MTRLRGAGWVLSLVVLLAACGSPPPAPAQAARPPSQASQVGSLLPCLDVPEEQDPISADDAAAQVEEITSRVEATRGHRFGKDVSPEFVTGEEVARRIADEVNTEYSADEADADRRILAALGAVPADTDLRALLAGLLAGQVVGFYDTKTEALVVASGDLSAPLDLLTQSILAHELDHALVDAVFGLPDEELEGPSDAALALLALVEGDAVLTQERFILGAIQPGEQLGLTADPKIAEALAQLQNFPHVLRAELAFPYNEGALFVCGLYAQGGWPAVDAAYRERPTTSAQILFPQRYATREGAVDPRDPGTLGGAWRRARTDTIGAAELLWLFEAPGDDPQAGIDDPFGAAAAWAGGEVHLWTDGPATAVGVALVDRGNGTLCAAVARWYAAAFPGDRDAERRPGETLARDGQAQDAVLRCGGRDVRLGIAPDLATARALAS